MVVLVRILPDVTALCRILSFQVEREDSRLSVAFCELNSPFRASFFNEYIESLISVSYFEKNSAELAIKAEPCLGLAKMIFHRAHFPRKWIGIINYRTSNFLRTFRRRNGIVRRILRISAEYIVILTSFERVIARLCEWKQKSIETSKLNRSSCRVFVGYNRGDNNSILVHIEWEYRPFCIRTSISGYPLRESNIPTWFSSEVKNTPRGKLEIQCNAFVSRYIIFRSPQCNSARRTSSRIVSREDGTCIFA